MTHAGKNRCFAPPKHQNFQGPGEAAPLIADADRSIYLFEFDFKNEKTVEAWGVDLREAINNYKKGNWIDHTTTFESFSSSDAGESEFEIKIKNI